MTTDDKALSFVPQILDAHDKALSAQRSGFKSSLDHAIDAGELLEKAKETVGSGWTKWREQHLPKIPQTTASLYMRLAKNKDKLSTTPVSNAVANLGSDRKLNLR